VAFGKNNGSPLVLKLAVAACPVAPPTQSSNGVNRRWSAGTRTSRPARLLKFSQGMALLWAANQIEQARAVDRLLLQGQIRFAGPIDTFTEGATAPDLHAGVLRQLAPVQAQA